MSAAGGNMLKFGEKHPVWFEILLVIAAFLAAALFTVVGYIYNIHPALSSSLGRFVIGVSFLVIYKRAFKGGRPFANLLVLIPALLFAAWNLFYNLSAGMVFGGSNYFIEALITASAPAIFEEVLFRGILIYNLKRKGNRDCSCLFLSAAFFAALHLTNLVGLDIGSVALQVLYSFVVGLVLAAVYLRNRSILQVILIHFLIDFTNSIFVEQASFASSLHLILFGLLLTAEAIYAVWLTRNKEVAY